MRGVPAIVLAAVGPVAAVPANAAISSTFDSDSDGWLAADLPGNGDYAAPIATFEPTWNAAGGSPGGFISAADPSTNAYFFQAPAAYLGNRSEYVGGALTFEITTSHNNWEGDRIVVLVGDNGKVVVAPIAQPPVANTWLAYSVPLTASSFLKNNLQGTGVNAAELAAVMGDLEAIYVPAEFATPAIETTGLDSVSLVPEPASLLLLVCAAAAISRRRARAVI